jgi:hypothetical protein
MSVLTRGYGALPVSLILTQGYATALPLRETFSVPVPEGSVALHAAGSGGAPTIGSAEEEIGFGLDFSGWLTSGETISALALRVWAAPGAGSAGHDATSTVLQGARLRANVAVAVLQATTARTAYAVTCTVTTSTGRTLECRMPDIWCPA